MHRLSLRYGEHETWQLEGSAVGSARYFTTLPDALACARELTHAGETLIELRVSGFYACVHQTPGWPRRIHALTSAAA
jgi:hypothetical protein